MKVGFWKIIANLFVFSMLVVSCGRTTTIVAPTKDPVSPIVTTSSTESAAPEATAAPANKALITPTANLAPIKIGISLSLTGALSADGQGFQQGYQLWADTVNKNGGLLGRQVSLDILSDDSIPAQVQANYEKLITVDKVDLVFGPNSSQLTKSASLVADRYGYAMVEGAGGPPSVFNRELKNVFDVSLPSLNSLDSFGKYLLELPLGQRPTSIAYITEDDPFTQPQIDRLKDIMEKSGIKTAYYQVYPADTTDYIPIADKVIGSKAEVVVAGTFLPDFAAFMQRFKQEHYNPKALIATNGPDLGKDFLAAVGGAGNAEGILVGNLWWAGANYPDNAEMVKAYLAQYGGTAEGMNPNIAEGYAVGQVVKQIVEKIQSIDNTKILAELSSGSTYSSVQGLVKFDDVGENVAAVALLFQWQSGKLTVVYPSAAASAKLEYPKTSWP